MEEEEVRLRLTRHIDSTDSLNVRLLGGSRKDTQPRSDSRPILNDEPHRSERHSTPISPPPLMPTSQGISSAKRTPQSEPPDSTPKVSHCFICSESYSEDDVIVVQGCQHLICKKCTSSYIISRLSENRFPIVCPLCQMDDLYEHHRKFVLYIVYSYLILDYSY